MATIEDILHKSRIAVPEKRKEDFRVQMLPLEQLYPSKNQFYSEETIEELAMMIHLAGGIKQNLLVRKMEAGKYEIIAGHKRRLAAKYLVEELGLKEYALLPCKIETVEDLMAEFHLIVTNSTQRERTDWEKMKEVERLREIIPQLPGNEKMKGRALRETIAKITNLSKSNVGQFEHISSKLVEEGKRRFEEGTLKISTADQIASLPEEDQEQLLQKSEIKMKDVEEFKEKKEKPENKNKEIANRKSNNLSASGSQILFINKEHEIFYNKQLDRCRKSDAYHKALIYCLGLSKDTRDKVDRIYDFKIGTVKPECLQEGWQTSSSTKIVRMAFNLYCNDTPSVFDIEDVGEKMRECKRYTVEDIFCCSYAKYFWEAIKIRYPEYL